MKVCWKCNTVNDDQATNCVNCGAKLPIPMQALVCPNCGKVCSLDTKKCPACGQDLTAVAAKRVLPKVDLQPAKHNKHLLVILAICACVIGIFTFAYLSTHYTADYNQTQYLGLVMNYYDKRKQFIGRTVFVIKGHSTNQETSKYRYQLAYLGNTEATTRQFGNRDPVHLRHLFERNPHHYQLTASTKQLQFSGPQQQIVYLKAPDRHGLFNQRLPLTLPQNYRRIKVTGQKQIYWVKLHSIYFF